MLEKKDTTSIITDTQLDRWWAVLRYCKRNAGVENDEYAAVDKIISQIFGNAKRVSKLKMLPRFDRYDKARAYVIAECQCVKLKISQELIQKIGFYIGWTIEKADYDAKA